MKGHEFSECISDGGQDPNLKAVATTTAITLNPKPQTLNPKLEESFDPRRFGPGPLTSNWVLKNHITHKPHFC